MIEKIHLRASWRKVRSHLYEPDVVMTLAQRINNFNWLKYERDGVHREFWQPGSSLGTGYNGCWWQSYGRGRRHPDSPSAYFLWQSCHWIANWSCLMGNVLRPDLYWGILKGHDHTVAVGYELDPTRAYTGPEGDPGRLVAVIDWIGEWVDGLTTAQDSLDFVGDGREITSWWDGCEDPEDEVWFWDEFPELCRPVDNPRFAEAFNQALALAY